MKHDKIQDDSKEPTGSFTRLVPTDSERLGIIVGAGIYVLIGKATALAGPRVWMAFVLAATLSALTAMSYAELASMYPKAASEFEYSRQVAPRLVAFVVGWVMICGLIVAAAAVSLGFGRYFRQFLDVDERLPAAGLLFIVALTASAGIRRSAAITTLLSLIQVGGLLFVIAIGAPHIGEVDLFTSAGGTGSVIGAAALVFFAFIGFDEVTTLAEETRNPSRTVPRALLFGLGISTLLYVGVSIAAVSVLGANQLAVSERPLADVLDHVLGGSGQNVLAAVALLATTNTTLLCVTAASRMQFGMAEAGARPNRLTNPCPTARFRSCPYWGCRFRDAPVAALRRCRSGPRHMPRRGRCRLDVATSTEGKSRLFASESTVRTMMSTNVEHCFNSGRGRCDRFATPECSTELWFDGLGLFASNLP